MAWDTERTKRLLLDAATAEFSEHGLAGARVDRIAAAAGVNKERIYQYFGNKESLFETVLGTRLVNLIDTVPMVSAEGDAVGAAAVADYVGRLFDHHLADTTIPRLIFWEGLELGDIELPPDRVASHDQKLDTLQRMLPGVGRRATGELLLTIVTLVNAFPVLAQLDRQMTGGETAAGGHDRRLAERRAIIVDAVAALAQAAIDRAAAGDASD
ncbi:TetR/AcrR family transcriptional regulator [Agromyces larvae]|uniref:TetR/AcrR family transcriptional regulator n=1 Tax=Agromyces larvae TaxID=2929802 RepID=A0ABY4BUA1_9MICO|nr:TetR/AcrR family transcriptional regulator [Agromyces larvae]UOE42783.1 TetR/AcrR family transcriptional regulator [Agromyces larvae]